LIMAQGVNIRSAQLADLIIEELTSGKPLRQICREQSVGKSAVYDWLDDDAEFLGRFTRARERGGHEIADQCIEIADDQEEDPASRRVRVETRLKLLAKWHPTRYGEQSKLALTGPDGGAIKTEAVGVSADDMRKLTEALLQRPTIKSDAT
jgi:hypothetical protein